jgi:uncharacterized protein (TIGR03382 family)
MKMKNVCALGAVLTVTSAANAAFVGLYTVDYVGAGWVANGYAGLVTCRVYADFDNPGDFMLSGFGAPGMPLAFSSWDGAFYNAVPTWDSLTAPLDLTGLGIWTNQWDSYVDIGLDDSAGDMTQLSPGFGAAVANLAANFSTTNAAWFITPIDPQGTAGNYPGNDVLIAQLTVAAGGPPVRVTGTAGISWNDPSGANTLSWASFECIPAPGALALLGLAGLVGRRRR